jgi:Mg/Co/Ni transporter MgtE
MDFDMITVRDDITVEVVLRYLRRLDEMPDHTDQLFVVDRQQYLRGLLPVSRLLVTDLDAPVTTIMTPATVKLEPNENAQEAATAFERYDLVSAPVVDSDGKLIGRVTVNAVVDFIREETDSEKLSAGGLSEEEDLFASVWSSVKNRWTWLAINLVTAIHSVARHRHIRRIHREDRRSGCAHADCRRHRGQFRQPDHHDDRTLARARSNYDVECAPSSLRRRSASVSLTG